jgi:hypothetical protein
MAKEKLTGESLLFSSYLHSQGGFDAQVAIFRYMETQFGIAPDFMLGAKQLGKYRRFLAGAERSDSATHPGVGYDDSLVQDNVQAVQNHWLNTKNTAWVKWMRTLEGDDTNQELTDRIVERENKILGLRLPWGQVAERGPLVESRQLRLRQRIACGKTSFLRYYGELEHPSGFEEFDQMYADLWQVYDSRQHDKMYTDHRQAIETVEEQFSSALGGTAIAACLTR